MRSREHHHGLRTWVKLETILQDKASTDSRTTSGRVGEALDLRGVKEAPRPQHASSTRGWGVNSPTSRRGLVVSQQSCVHLDVFSTYEKTPSCGFATHSVACSEGS